MNGRKMPVYILFVLIFLATGGAAYGQAYGSSDAVETAGSGMINWTTGEAFATGIGAPPAKPANPAQARAMAERAAQVVAYRNLLEIVKGVRIDSETVVENFMTKSDVIRTRVEGVVKGARIVKKQYMSDGAVEVLIAMPFKGEFLNAVVPDAFGRPGAATGTYIASAASQKPHDIKTSLPKPEPAKPSPPTPAATPERKPEPVKTAPSAPELPEKRPEPAKQAEPVKQPEPAPSAQSEPTIAFKGGTATGLVIDGRGLGLRPALLPKVIDQQGQEIYVGQVVTRTNAVEQGVAGYAKDVNAAANNFRVTDNPAVMRAVKASGATKTDIVIGQADAQTLRQISGKGDFLQNCRVIIVY